MASDLVIEQDTKHFLKLHCVRIAEDSTICLADRNRRRIKPQLKKKKLRKALGHLNPQTVKNTYERPTV